MRPEADRDLHQRLVALAEATPDLECCGLVVRASTGQLEPWPMENVAPDPASAFELQPEALLRALKRLDADGAALVAVYHSHPRDGAWLSGRDLAGALIGGSPALPGVEQWVVALAGGRAARLVAHRWGGAGFDQRELWPAGGEHPGGAPSR